MHALGWGTRARTGLAVLYWWCCGGGAPCTRRGHKQAHRLPPSRPPNKDPNPRHAHAPKLCQKLPATLIAMCVAPHPARMQPDSLAGRAPDPACAHGPPAAPSNAHARTAHTTPRRDIAAASGASLDALQSRLDQGLAQVGWVGWWLVVVGG